MALLDGPLRSIVKTIVHVLGTTCELNNDTADYNFATGVETNKLNSKITVSCSPPSSYSSSEVQGTTIQQSDLKVIVSAQDLGAYKVAVGLGIKVSGLTMRVVGVTPMVSGDEVAAYEMQCRA